jgi:subtilisin family serine protease
MVPGVVLVGLKSNVTMSRSATGVQSNNAMLNTRLVRLGARSVEPLFPFVRRPRAVSSVGRDVDLTRIYRLRLAPNADVLRAVQELQADPSVAYAEPDYLAHVIATPNDPEYANQWGLTKISAPAAWDTTTGSNDVVIAVVDAGIDATHPDLGSQLWTNPGEIAGNGVDDDSNGYMDDVRGWNIFGNNADLSDTTGHGTQVAGVIAAATNNSTGIAGVCWNCRLMIVKVMQPGGIANYSDIAAGMAYAAQKGAKVINLSLGGNSDSATLKAAIVSASSTAVIVGGTGNDNSSAAFYPAAYEDYVLAVAGTTITDTKVASSNYGTWVDVSAPGEAIRTTFSGGTYADSSGTSMAAPFVAGLAGLIRSQNPTWSANLTRAQIVNTTDNIDGVNPGYAGKLGSGRINAQRAVTTTATPLFRYVSYAANGTTNVPLKAGATSAIAVTLRNDWKDASSVAATLTTTSSDVTITDANGSWGAIASGQSVANGSDMFQVFVPAGKYSLTIPFTLNVIADGWISSFNFTTTTEPQTITVGGMLTTDTVWTNDRIYIVVNDLGVASGVTLTIQPGTVVKFHPDKRLLVWGVLIADGTPAQPIRFTSNTATPAPGDWDRIFFDDSSIDASFDGAGNYVGGSILRFVIIEYGNSIYLNDAAPFISHNTFTQMGTSAGICGGSNDDATAQPVIADNTLVGTGIVLNWNVGRFALVRNTVSGALIHVEMAAMPNTSPGQGSIIGNFVSNVPPDFFGQQGTGISGSGQLDLIGNRVINSGEGIVVNTNGLISRNLVANNSSNGLRILGSPTVVSNTILSNGDAAFTVDGRAFPSIPHHNNLIANQGQYALRNDTVNNVSAADNWWGTTDVVAIEAAIYDGFDQVGKGIVSYSPYLSGPEPSAPAYVHSISLTPASPVGIQSVIFDLVFSRAMDPSINPTVTFGATSPYTSYAVLDNAQWLNSTQWRATYDIASLVMRGAYTVSISSAKGTDGMEIPTDARFGFTVDYASEITDQTPPNPPSVTATGKPGDASFVQATWLATDPDSAITGYRYAIGSAAGTADIVNWTATTVTSMSRSGLGFVAGRQYWFAVQAKNTGGLWSSSGYRAFVAGQQSQVLIYLPLIMR